MKFINTQNISKLINFHSVLWMNYLLQLIIKEGVAGAYILTQNTIQIPNNISIITTHFDQLTKLSKSNKQKIKNMKMSLENNKYTYKLTQWYI